MNKLILFIASVLILFSFLRGSSFYNEDIGCNLKFKTVSKLKYKPLYDKLFLGCKTKNNYFSKYFYKTNASHLLCISGLHVTSIFLFTFLFLNLIFYILKIKYSYFYLSSFLSLFISGAYVYLIGFEVPRLRALIMLSVFIFSSYVKLFKNNFEVLFFALSIVLFVFPNSVYSYSFYYSFMAVLAILLSFKFRFFKNDLINISFFIFLLLVPLNLHSNGTIDFSSPFLNILIIPAFSLFYFPFSFVLFVLSKHYYYAGFILDKLTKYLILYFKYWHKFFTSNLSLDLSNISTLELVYLYIFILILIFFFFLKKKRKNLVFIFSSFLVFVFLSFFVFKPNTDNFMRVFNLGVVKNIKGAGDLILLKTKNKTLVIDTGFGKKDTYRAIKELKRNKIKDIDFLFITHTHIDHVGGLKTFIKDKSLNIKNIVVSKHDYKYFIKNKSFKKKEFILAFNEMKILIEKGFYISFLNPYENKAYKDKNKNALAFLIYLNNYVFCINSDIPVKNAYKIYKHIKNKNNLIYQSPHHCSSLDKYYKKIKINPLISFCSSYYIPKKNYGFPIYSTRKCGDITINLTKHYVFGESSKCPKLMFADYIP